VMDWDRTLKKGSVMDTVKGLEEGLVCSKLTTSWRWWN
jgi:hypothetical protein